MSKRRKITAILDPRVIEYLDLQAQKAGLSRNRYIELHFIKHAQSQGEFPFDFLPLPDNRGGDRRSPKK